jgi:hypothetical protein
MSAHTPSTPPVCDAADASSVNARYLVVGPSDPSFLSRLVEPVAKLGEVPTRVHASREAGDGSQLSVDLRLGGVSPRTAELVENALRRIVGVQQVIAVVERPI